MLSPALLTGVNIHRQEIHCQGKITVEKVIVYVDGFNLYFGIREKFERKYLWLNIAMLAQSLLKEDQQLKRVKYFTSRVRNDPEKEKRQNVFLEALETCDKLDIFYGHYLINAIKCYRCGNIFPKPNEKMTDVNIAVELLTDAFQDKYDTAILISGDSDLSGPVIKIKHLFPCKKIIIVFPPGRKSYMLQKIADSSFILGRKKLKDSQFPDTVLKDDGYVLERPKKWC
jgi:uncharacterized LabA/DUF88 family protein